MNEVFISLSLKFANYENGKECLNITFFNPLKIYFGLENRFFTESDCYFLKMRLKNLTQIWSNYILNTFKWRILLRVIIINSKCNFKSYRGLENNEFTINP